ncbi:MAG: response regulator [bacterium]|nr:response regulator [bacterium]
MTQRRVLVMHEEPAVCAYLKDLLKYFGYEVDCVLSCKAAIERLPVQTYDVLLLDTAMSDGNGTRIITWLKEHVRRDRVILMNDPLKHSKWMDLGEASTLTKPVQPSDLKRILQMAAC